jgi:hypothetical protein
MEDPFPGNALLSNSRAEERYENHHKVMFW